MQLVTGGELFDRIVSKQSYTEREAADTVYTLCDALNHLHARQIVHRDLKPENLLYSSPADDAVIKVADFGLARMVSGTYAPPPPTMRLRAPRPTIRVGAPRVFIVRRMTVCLCVCACICVCAAEQ